jgi:hypothetical protein
MGYGQRTEASAPPQPTPPNYVKQANQNEQVGQQKPQPQRSLHQQQQQQQQLQLQQQQQQQQQYQRNTTTSSGGGDGGIEGLFTTPLIVYLWTHSLFITLIGLAEIILQIVATANLAPLGPIASGTWAGVMLLLIALVTILLS